MAADGTITLKTSIDKTGATKDLNSLLSELNTQISKGIVISVGVSGASEAVNAAKEITAESEKAEKATKKRQETSKNASKEEAEGARLAREEIRERERLYRRLFDILDERAAREAETRNRILESETAPITGLVEETAPAPAPDIAERTEEVREYTEAVTEAGEKTREASATLTEYKTQISDVSQQATSAGTTTSGIDEQTQAVGALTQATEQLSSAATESGQAAKTARERFNFEGLAEEVRGEMSQVVQSLDEAYNRIRTFNEKGLLNSEWSFYAGDFNPEEIQESILLRAERSTGKTAEMYYALANAAKEAFEMMERLNKISEETSENHNNYAMATVFKYPLGSKISAIAKLEASFIKFRQAQLDAGQLSKHISDIYYNLSVLGEKNSFGVIYALSREFKDFRRFGNVRKDYRRGFGVIDGGNLWKQTMREIIQSKTAELAKAGIELPKLDEEGNIVRKFSETVSQAHEKISESSSSVQDVVSENTSSIEREAESISQAEHALVPVSDISERTREVREYAEAVEEAGERTRETSSAESAPMFRIRIPTNQLEQDIIALQDKIRQATESGNTAQAESYRKLMSDLSSYYKKLEDADALIAKREGAPESQYQEITAQIGKAQAEAEKFAASITDTVKNSQKLNLSLRNIKSLEGFREAAASAREAANTSAEYGRQMANAASESGNATSAVQQFQQIYEKALRDGNTVQANIVASMQKTISGIEHQNVLTDKYKQKLAELYAQQRQIGGEGVDIKLDTEIASYTQKLAHAQANTNKLTSELQRLSDRARASKANLSSVESTLNKYGTTAKNAGVQTTGLRGKILQLYKSATSGSKAATKSTNGFAGSLNKVAERFKGLTSRVFVFSVWTMAMRGLRNTIANVLKSNKDFSSSLEKLKASLWTAFAPIINFVVPILTKLVQWITAAITAITKFIAKLTGVSYESLVKGGKALSEQASGYDDVADSADKAKKAQDRYLASFDKINKAQDTSQDTADKEVTQPSPFDSLGKSTLSKEVEEQLNKVMAIIGGALMAVGVIMCLAGAIPTGIQLILIGALALYGAAAIAWDSTNKEVKKTLQTIMTTIGGALMAIGVILLCVGNLPLGIMLTILGALTLYGSSQLDNQKTGKTVKQFLTEIALVVAAASLAIGVILLCVGNIPLGIALVVAGLAIGAAALKFGEVSEKTKEMITTIALIAGTALLVLGIILVCFGIFPLGIGLIVAGAGSLGVAMLTGKDTVLKVITNIWNGIKGFWNKHIAKIFTGAFWKNKFSSIGEGLKTAAKAALNGLIWIINKFIDGLNLMLIPQRFLIMSIAKLFGSDLALDDIKIPHIPQLAKGGIVPTQTLAMIGERGKEAVIPLENNLGWLDKMSDMIASKVGAGESTINLTIQLDGSVIYKDIVKRNREATRRTGKNALV